MSALFDRAGAEFSDCGHYRYVLWRRWAWEGYASQVMFIGLNPSTADAENDDPTIRRCIGFAKAWGYSGLLMMNAYAFRATKPANMWKGRHTDDSPVVTSDPVGPGNDEAFGYRRTQAGLYIAAWGAHCEPERELQVCRAIGTTIHCLGRTKDGRPRHPLYLKADTELEVFWSPEDDQ
jgi:hypothetical protein